MSQDSLVSVVSSRPSTNQDMRRPRTLHISKSFSRLEPADHSPLIRSRASTIQSGIIPEFPSPQKAPLSPDSERKAIEGDVFARKDSDQEDESPSRPSQVGGVNQGMPNDFNEMPIELLSLTDRFIDSLSAKVHPTPPSVDRLSELFQEFYLQTAFHISTHISTLSSRQHRRNSPTASISSRSSSTTKGGNTRSVGTKEQARSPTRSTAEQQMLTTSEIAEKRRARKLLECKRLSLEEAVERRVCEGVYDRIWRHRSTQDEERDEKLRSRTAALSVVGIGLKELGIDVALSSEETKSWLAKARSGLVQMNDEKHPLGKLQNLTAAHKSIVETLAHVLPSSSSADEILPMLIYTLITTPPEGINVISNLHFIQRFRAANKIDGEAAYCLTGLEAAITFLETVDLASLRGDENLEGPSKSGSRPATPTAEKRDPIGLGQSSSPNLASPAITPASASSDASNSIASLRPLPSPATSYQANTPASPLHQRRLSHLLQPPSNALGAASDAVMNTADQSFKNIGNTLENSYKFLFGRLKEQRINGPGLNTDGTVVVPKTLEDARRLVGTSPSGEEDGPSSAASSIAEPWEEQSDGVPDQPEDKMLGLLVGRRQPRERSVDSVKSGSSGKKVLFADEKEPLKEVGTPPSPNPVATKPIPPTNLSNTTSNPAVESMRNLGNTLNPLNRLAGMSVMRGFGRTASSTPPALSAATEKSKELGANPPGIEGFSASSKAVAEASTASPTKEILKILPPIKRFVNMENPGDLKLGDVAELLRDYQRLANALKGVGAL
ncbi:MAG: hypothetical protein M1827_005909 [Pycnora praestabilis]|nr:MAG: hypothetical protein M1827_005909 [Pycnora praestabilis]